MRVNVPGELLLRSLSLRTFRLLNFVRIGDVDGILWEGIWRNPDLRAVDTYDVEILGVHTQVNFSKIFPKFLRFRSFMSTLCVPEHCWCACAVLY